MSDESNVPEWERRAKVGDKVVCIGSEWYSVSRNAPSVFAPAQGDILTISGIVATEECVCFVFTAYPQDNAYEWNGFKPLKTTEAGLSVLRAILNGSPVRESEPA
jgi:hypothetical protein